MEISAHAAKVASDIALAREYYVPDAEWTAESLGLFTQAVIQGHSRQPTLRIPSA